VQHVSAASYSQLRLKQQKKSELLSFNLKDKNQKGEEDVE
jgi:hypothetical protein